MVLSFRWRFYILAILLLSGYALPTFMALPLQIIGLTTLFYGLRPELVNVTLAENVELWPVVFSVLFIGFVVLYKLVVYPCTLLGLYHTGLTLSFLIILYLSMKIELSNRELSYLCIFFVLIEAIRLFLLCDFHFPDPRYITLGIEVGQESPKAFYLVPFSLFFIRDKRIIMFLFSFLIAYLTCKRIIVLAILLSIPLMYFPWNWATQKMSRDFLSLVAIVLVFLAVMCSVYGGVNMESAGVVSYGRTYIWRSLNLFGYGIGGTSDHILSIMRGQTTLPHSEYLRLALEWSILAMLAYLFVLVRLVLDPLYGTDLRWKIVGLVSLAFLMATDNVLIYVTFLAIPYGVYFGKRKKEIG